MRLKRAMFVCLIGFAGTGVLIYALASTFASDNRGRFAVLQETAMPITREHLSAIAMLRGRGLPSGPVDHAYFLPVGAQAVNRHAKLTHFGGL